MSPYVHFYSALYSWTKLNINVLTLQLGVWMVWDKLIIGDLIYEANIDYDWRCPLRSGIKNCLPVLKCGLQNSPAPYSWRKFDMRFREKQVALKRYGKPSLTISLRWEDPHDTSVTFIFSDIFMDSKELSNHRNGLPQKSMKSTLVVLCFISSFFLSLSCSSLVFREGLDGPC